VETDKTRLLGNRDFHHGLLGNWIKLHRAGRLKGASGKHQVTAEQMEISRLRAELARVTMERDILGKATAYFAKGQK
jgi:transposase